MIKVTIGESKTQEVKEFPKLIQTYIGYIVEVYKCKTSNNYIGIYRTGQYKGEIVTPFCIDNCSDYNEPITIQNQ